jgi:hypothetical protein
MSAPLASSVAKVAEEPLAIVLEPGVKERKQEGISEGSNEKQLEAVVPTLETRRFKGQVGFGIAPSHLDLPAAGIGANEGKGVVNGVDGLVGKQVPGGTTFALAGNNEPKGCVGEIRMEDLGVIDADFALTVAASIPEQTMGKGALAATDFPSVAHLPFCINELVMFLPAHDKAQAVVQQLMQPRAPSKSSVENM